MAEKHREIGGEKMPIDGEYVVRGWRNLADYLGLSERKLRGMKPELTSCGSVFFMRLGRKKQRTLCFFQSEIKKWCRIKASKGEVI